MAQIAINGNQWTGCQGVQPAHSAPEHACLHNLVDARVQVHIIWAFADAAKAPLARPLPFCLGISGLTSLFLPRHLVRPVPPTTSCYALHCKPVVTDIACFHLANMLPHPCTGILPYAASACVPEPAPGHQAQPDHEVSCMGAKSPLHVAPFLPTSLLIEW